MRTLLLTLCVCALLPCLAIGQTLSTLDSLMPVPAKVQSGAGQLAIGQLFRVAVTGARDARVDAGARRFVDQLSRQTGMPLDSSPVEAAQATLLIHVVATGRKVQAVGEDESYTLAVTDKQAVLHAETPLGALHGLQTFLQLVGPSSSGFAVPVATIEDQPRFAWRGLLIDVSRHFFPIEVLKRNLDGMAAVKLNVLHWHLSDDEGFRVQSKVFPKLQKLGSQGDYYTQAEVRDLIAYARERGIRVVPEFDMPGHSRAMVAAYPELASTKGPFQPGRIKDADTVLDPTRETTYVFLDKFVAEMAGLFPDAYFHIGGDEVNNKPWDSNPGIQHFIRAHGMKNNQDLQAYFNQRLQTIVSRHGKIMMGWDEILHPSLPKKVVVHSWRGQDSLAEAARQGHGTLLSYGYYIDLIWPAARHYAIDPMSGNAASLSPEEAKRILGGEACMWAEFITPETIDSRLWPRLAAVAERLWSPQSVTDPKSMYVRLDAMTPRLRWLGITSESNYVPMLRRLAGGSNIDGLRVLADALEPTKDYTRSEVWPEPPVKRTPLNRLVDATRPESTTALRFSWLVNDYLTGSRDAAIEGRLRASLLQWQGNDAALRPLLERSFLLQEAQPLSADLANLSSAALQALDAIKSNRTLPGSWRTEQLAVVQRSLEPRANLVIAVAPAVQKLIEAASPAPGMTQ